MRKFIARTRDSHGWDRKIWQFFTERIGKTRVSLSDGKTIIFWNNFTPSQILHSMRFYNPHKYVTNWNEIINSCMCSILLLQLYASTGYNPLMQNLFEAVPIIGMHIRCCFHYHWFLTSPFSLPRPAAPIGSFFDKRLLYLVTNSIMIQSQEKCRRARKKFSVTKSLSALKKKG